MQPTNLQTYTPAHLQTYKLAPESSAAKFIDTKFASLGATRMQEIGLGDDQDDDKYDTAYGEWLPEFFKIQNAPESTYMVTQKLYACSVLGGRTCEKPIK